MCDWKSKWNANGTLSKWKGDCRRPTCLKSDLYRPSSSGVRSGYGTLWSAATGAPSRLGSGGTRGGTIGSARRGNKTPARTLPRATSTYTSTTTTNSTTTGLESTSTTSESTISNLLSTIAQGVTFTTPRRPTTTPCVSSTSTTRGGSTSTITRGDFTTGSTSGQS